MMACRLAVIDLLGLGLGSGFRFEFGQANML